MRKTSTPKVTYEDNPEWTEKDFKKAKRAADILPPELLAVLPKRGKGQRGIQKLSKKEQVTIRYNADVLNYFRSKGPGWQTRMNAVLREWVEKHQ